MNINGIEITSLNDVKKAMQQLYPTLTKEDGKIFEALVSEYTLASSKSYWCGSMAIQEALDLYFNNTQDCELVNIEGWGWDDAEAEVRYYLFSEDTPFMNALVERALQRILSIPLPVVYETVLESAFRTMIDPGSDEIEIFTMPSEGDEYVVFVNGRSGVGEIHPSEFMRSAIQRAVYKIQEKQNNESLSKEEKTER